MTITRRFALAAFACLSATFSVPLRAATMVQPASLADLVSRCDAVVLAEARGSWGLARGSLIFTRTELIVVESLSGDDPPGASIEVEAPGGEAGGKTWVVPGSPRFVEGHRYFLPLSRKPGGPWLPSMLSWGILEESVGLGGRLLLAPMSGTELPGALPRLDGVTPEPLSTYGEEALLEHLGQVLDGRAAWDSSLVAARPEELPASGQGAAVPGQCSFLGSGALNARWRAFDSGGTATIFADSTGDLSVPGGGFRQVVDALNTWHDIPRTSVNLLFGGPAALSINCAEGAQADTIVFNDPCSDISDLDGCTGVLAFGGPLDDGTTHRFDGATWITATGWIVVVNNGTGCLGLDNYRLMLAHELGHGLGFGHVADQNALMNGSCCNQINGTDMTCARYVYPASDPANLRPQVDAGPDRTFLLARNSVRISGTATDDGRPAGGTLTTTWSLLGGPGSVSFADKSALETTVTFTAPGVHVLGLTASDGNLLRIDSMTATVSLWAGSVAEKVFEQRVNGYSGTVDTFLQAESPLAGNSRTAELNVDSDDPANSGLDVQALLRFEGIFGAAQGQVPPGAVIQSASLDLVTSNDGNGAVLHRMKTSWSDGDTWNTFGGNGIQAGAEAEAAADATASGRGAATSIDVTSGLAAWSADPCQNQGWAFLPLGTDGWDFSSAEGSNPPVLTVRYAASEDEHLIQAGESWQFMKGRVNPPADWNTRGFVPDASWLSGKTGIGYGDGDDATVLADMAGAYLTIYCRREFSVPDAKTAGRFLLSIDYDDGFVAYLNGREAARSSTLGAPGAPILRSTEALQREAGSIETYVLDSSLIEAGVNVLAIEIHNSSIDSGDLSFMPALTRSPVLIDEGAEWSFLRGTAPVPEGWTGLEFDDSAWEEGPTGIGFEGGDDATVLEDMQGRYTAVFARRAFDLQALDGTEELLLTVIHDDGVVLHLNGEEIGRANMPQGVVRETTRALRAIEPSAASFRLPSALLRQGRNVLAASIHNSSVDSDDLTFVPVLLLLAGRAREVTCGAVFQRGDATGDGALDITDAVRILSFLFAGESGSICPDAADVDDNGAVSLTDAVRLLEHLFRGGEAPPSPGVECGSDPTPDTLEDCSTPACAE